MLPDGPPFVKEKVMKLVIVWILFGFLSLFIIDRIETRPISYLGCAFVVAMGPVGTAAFSLAGVIQQLKPVFTCAVNCKE